MNSAHAGLADTLKSTLVKEFIDIISEVQKPPVIGTSSTIAKNFTKALKELEAAAKNGVTNIDDIAFEGTTVKALINVFEAGGVDTLRRLRNHQGFRTLNGKPTIQEFVEMVANLDMSKVKLIDPDLKGLKRVFKGFDVKEGTKDAQGFRNSHGATHEFFDIVTHLDELASIQTTVKIGPESFKQSRIYDYISKDGWHVDKKAWSVSNIQKYLKGSAKGDILIPGEESTGQLFRDLVAAGNGTKIRWNFDARAGELGVDKIKELVRQGLDENRKKIAKVAGETDFSDDVLDRFVDKVMTNFDVKISEI